MVKLEALYGQSWLRNRFVFVIYGVPWTTTERVPTQASLFLRGTALLDDGHVFSVQSSRQGQAGEFWICVADSGAESMHIRGTLDCYIQGRFRILATAHGPVRAARLAAWWEQGLQGAQGRSAAWKKRYAEHLAIQIKRRGLTQPAPMEEV